MHRAPRSIVLNKPVGQTPLEAIQDWKRMHAEYAELPATYAGRLDPMASGKLLILLGEECKKRDSYTGLDKEYEIEIVLGVSTDTGDALGLSDISAQETVVENAALRAAFSRITGTHRIPYPAFSSKTVNGKPLFLYALEGTLNTIQVPSHGEHIYKITLIENTSLSKSELQDRIENTLSKVPKSNEPSKELGADFRQDEIRLRWQEAFFNISDRKFIVLTLRVACASGTYMRSVAERLGKQLGTCGFALSITRTKIGTYVPLGPFSFLRDTFHYESR